MKILVFAHRLEIGGTQTNAIELAAALRDLYGHQVVLFATPGPAAEIARQNGLRFVPAPAARFHPSPVRASALRQLVREERPDLIHAWDWWQCIDAYYTVHLLMRVPMIVSDMMMFLTRVLPKTLPTTFGTPELVDQAKRAGWRRATLMLPPVDVDRNAPQVVGAQAFRSRYQVTNQEVTLVTVSRLSNCMKLESLTGTIEVVRALGDKLPLRLVIVGDGLARSQLERAAAEANARLGREAVTLTGALVDPRPAYVAADVVVGMGGSALRGMAFGKPVVVVGERGFCALLTPQTAPMLFYKGMYGRGDGAPIEDNLAPVIYQLAVNPQQLPALGGFSREFVTRHYKLESVCSRLATLCERAVEERNPLHISVADGLRTAAIYLRQRAFLVPSADPDVKSNFEPEVRNA